MSELDKILEWVENNTKEYFPHDFVDVDDLKDFINELKNPPKKLTWQCRTVNDPEWRNIGDGEYENLQYLSRFTFRQVEI